MFAKQNDRINCPVNTSAADIALLSGKEYAIACLVK